MHAHFRLVFASAFLFGIATAFAPAPAGAQDPVEKQVAVTVDDLPVACQCDTAAQEDITRRLVGALKAHGVPAVGFVNEVKLQANGAVDPAQVALLRQWLDAGMELGNHTYSHPSFHNTPLEVFQEEVLKGERVSRRLSREAGRPYRYFRHPFLHAGTDLQMRAAFEDFLKARGYTVAPVTLDNSDWIFSQAYDNAIRDGDAALQRRIREAYIPYMMSRFTYYGQQSEALFGRDIPHVLLIHANRINADTFGELAQAIRAVGYTFARLEEVLEDPAYETANTWAGPGGISWVHRWALTAGKRGAFFQGETETPAFVMEAAGIESE